MEWVVCPCHKMWTSSPYMHWKTSASLMDTEVDSFSEYWWYDIIRTGGPHLAHLWFNDENRYTNMSLILLIAKSLEILAFFLNVKQCVVLSKGGQHCKWQNVPTNNHTKQQRILDFWFITGCISLQHANIWPFWSLLALYLYICLSSFYSNDSMHKFHRYILQLWQIGYPKSVVWVNSKFSINRIEPEKKLSLFHKSVFTNTCFNLPKSHFTKPLSKPETIQIHH